ncbi:MAG TPA: protein kinase [Planctomycetaceae bacterium]|nr:protein kinase [Planctomycetaceae bacterium]HQZ65835.1 protein kinase [Planctomycetaceae bacterium]
MKVLVAEDSATARTLLAGQLKLWGYEPVLAVDGQEALDILKGDDPPRLAILDWQMPRMDGIEVSRRIKEDPDQDFTYVIILSARDGEDDMVAGLTAGADDYVPKSSNPVILKSRLTAAARILERVPPKEWAKPNIDGYTVQNLIGKGAYATVWKAVQNATSRDVALKILRMDLSTDGVFSRFAREIRLMEKLNHPNIAQIYDSRVDAGLGYCAMELIDGAPLQKYIKDHKISKAELLEIVAQICDGLQHAHENGIVHRDVKPSNIMMTQQGTPKLVDFGLGRNLFRCDTEREASQTMEGYVVGTPMYMAPEQARGENDRLDGRADVYAVGIILYVGLVRRHPHDMNRKDRSAAINEVAYGDARRPSEVKPGFDPDLEKILMKAIARDPDDRYATAAELARDLRSFAQPEL